MFNIKIYMKKEYFLTYENDIKFIFNMFDNIGLEGSTGEGSGHSGDGCGVETSMHQISMTL